MQRLTLFLNKHIVPPLTRVSENSYLSAIRAGMVATVPFTIVGSMFLIAAFLPLEAWQSIVGPYKALLEVPVIATFGILSVIVCFAVSYDLAKREKQDAVMSALLATALFLLLQVSLPERAAAPPPASPAAGEAAEAQLAEEDEPGPALLTENLGSAGLFTAILIALITVKARAAFDRWNLVIRLPQNVPAVVVESFTSLTPLIFLMLAFWCLRFVLGVDINHLVQVAFKPLVFALNTLPGILVYAFLVTLLWSVGINGDNAMDALVAPIFLQYLDANRLALAQGEPLPFITSYGFFTSFVNVGGTGATIALALIMLNSKEPGFRKISRLSLPAQIFQINEPIFFGFPIVLNPIFMIPYILNALILTLLTFLLMDWNLIDKPVINVPWTTPPVIGHYLVSNGDWRAAVWGALSIVIAGLVYFPFAKVAERQRLRAESTGTAHE